MKGLFQLPLFISVFIYFHNTQAPLTLESKNVIRNYDISSLIQIREQYSQLSCTDKLQIWRTRLSRIDNLCLVTSVEKNFADSLANNLTLDFFDTMNSEVDTKVKKITDRAIELFGKHRAGFIFASLIPTLYEYNSLISINQDKYPNCNCNKSSDWCSGLSVCKDKTCVTKVGCGTFWLYSCNGTCAILK